jgi:quercetin dioxygenase-like cupin family protein
MDNGAGRERLSLLGNGPGPGFDLRVVTIAGGATRPYRAPEWTDALVVVERGEIELEGLGGGRTRFGRGDVLCLGAVPLRALHNPGPRPALLVAVSRRTPATPPSPPATR